MTIILSADAIIAGQSVAFSVVYQAVPPLAGSLDGDYDAFQDASLLVIPGDGGAPQSIIGARALAPDGSLNVGPLTFTYSMPGNYSALVSAQIFVRSVSCQAGTCSIFPNGHAIWIDQEFERISVNVPEPATAALMAIAMLVVMVRSISRSFFR